MHMRPRQRWNPPAAAIPRRRFRLVSLLTLGGAEVLLCAGFTLGQPAIAGANEVENVSVRSIESQSHLRALLQQGEQQWLFDPATVSAVAAQTMRLYASSDLPEEATFAFSVASMGGPKMFEPVVVETTPEVMRGLLDALRIPGIEDEDVEDIASAFQVVAESRDGAVAPEPGAAEVRAAAETMWAFSSRLLGARQTALAEIDSAHEFLAANGEAHMRVEAIRRLLMKSISAATTLEERHFDDLRVQYLGRLARMQDDASSAVAILIANGADGTFRFGGSGFVYRDCVTTCVHLFSLEDTSMHGERRELITDRIRVVPIDWLSGAHLDAWLTLSGDSFLRPELDVAAIRLAEASTNQEREWRDAIRARVAKGTLAYGSAFDARLGVLYGFGALQDSTPEGPAVRARWIPFGRIVFPYVVSPSMHAFDPAGNIVDTRPDQWFARAFAAALIGDPIRLCEVDSMERALGSIDAVYDACEDGGVERTCRFRQTISPAMVNRQIATQADFQQAGRFPCFGTDLATSSGLSGAPLFLMNANGRSELVAIHHGRASAIESDEPQRRSLGNAGIAIPLSVFIEELDRWIESLDQ